MSFRWYLFLLQGTSFGESIAIQSLPLQNVPFYEGIEEFSQKIQQIREAEQREPLGFVLCGGSARAFAHIGVLQAMEENGIVPDFIVANSMGAIIGMLYSYGFSPDQMYKIASILNLNSYFDLVAPLKGGIVSVRKFTALINEVLGMESVDIKDCAIPVLLLTEDLNTKRQIWHASGDFAQVMVAAFAMSFFMEPVDYVLESRVKVKLVDSGTIDIAGLKVADAFSKNLIVSMAFYDKKLNLNNPIVVISRTISIGKERIAIGDIRQLQPVLIRNDVGKFSFMEFKKIHELVQVGYDSAMKSMNEIVARPHGYREFSERRKETAASSNELIKRLERNPEIKIQQNYLGMKIRPNISAVDYPSLQASSYLQKNPYIITSSITSSTELFYTNTSSNLTFAEFLIMQQLDIGGYFDLVYDSKLSYTAGGFIRSDISVFGLTSFVMEFGCG